MTDLAEFLLARIAEDEEPTWRLVPYDCPPGCCAPAGWVGHQCRYCDPAPVYGGTVEAITQIAEEHAETIHQRSRVLAECEARRAIVETLTDEWWSSNTMLNDRLLGLLTRPYASRPDYDQAWADQ